MYSRKTLTLAAALAALGTAAGAQAPTAAPPAHPGLFGGLLHRHPRLAPGMHPGLAPGLGAGSAMPLAGGIVGNKRSHVYHLPSDRSALPAAANRVYFRTEQQALAAGYHRAGSHNTPGGKIRRMPGMTPPLVQGH